MSLLLDTNAVIAFQKLDPTVGRYLRQFAASEVFVSSIVLQELHFGAWKSQRVRENLARLVRLPFASFDFTAEDAEVAGKIRNDMRARGTPIGPYDALIAGQALARGLTVVTRNTREFARVEGLSVEDWTV